MIYDPLLLLYAYGFGYGVFLIYGITHFLAESPEMEGMDYFMVCLSGCLVAIIWPLVVPFWVLRAIILFFVRRIRERREMQRQQNARVMAARARLNTASENDRRSYNNVRVTIDNAAVDVEQMGEAANAAARAIADILNVDSENITVNVREVVTSHSPPPPITERPVVIRRRARKEPIAERKVKPKRGPLKPE